MGSNWFDPHGEIPMDPSDPAHLPPKTKSRSREFSEGAWSQRDHDALNERMIQDEKDYYRRANEFG